ncbi:MAG: hypothetical protein IJ568_07595 [Bacilli bacterium]|nr:hypothetical protein [Bacilli bacterium]
MDKKKLTSNDVLEALSIRTNEILKIEKDKDDKKNSLNFWLFKFIYLAIYIFILVEIFDNIRDAGVVTLYYVGKSLRSVLSVIFISSMNFTKELIIIFLLFDHIKLFRESKYYKRLYSHDETMKKNKELVFKIIDVFLKITAICLMIVTVTLAGLAMFLFVYFIVMLINGTYIISPLVIFGSILAISILLFKHIQNKFFGSKLIVLKKYYIGAFLALFMGILFFAYEISGYEYVNTLPNGFKVDTKESVFDITEYDKVIVKSDTRLNNIELIVDDNLNDQIRVEFDYYKTSKIKYIYTYNDNNELNLTYTSILDINNETAADVLKLAMATFSNQTMYNYNMFKYPVIRVYVNSENKDKVEVRHN